MSKTEPLNISDKLAKLNNYVAWFEGEDFAIEESLQKFAEAQKLAEEIQNDLESFKNKVTIITKQFDKE